MGNDDKMFDVKMKEKFKKELNKIPEDINEEFDNMLSIIKNKGEKNMKKIRNIKRTVIVAASVLCALTISMQTAFAKELVDKVIKSISLNNITIFENQDVKWKDQEVSKVAKGKVFDRDGNIIKKITLSNKDAMYNENGEKVFGIDFDGTLITEEVQKENMEKNAKEYPVDDMIVRDTEKINGYTCFDVKLPAYLPEGFEFYYTEIYKDDNGEIFDEACGIYYINNKTQETLSIFQTYISEESSGETFFNNVEKVKVNGEEAIIGDEGIVWETNDVRYLMYTSFGRDENVKIAESIK